MSDTKTPRPIALGKFKPLLTGTSLARICAAALPGKHTVAGIGKAAGLREDQVVHRLRHGSNPPVNAEAKIPSAWLSKAPVPLP
jgi:hypothetical protein